MHDFFSIYNAKTDRICIEAAREILALFYWSSSRSKACCRFRHLPLANLLQQHCSATIKIDNTYFECDYPGMHEF